MIIKSYEIQKNILNFLKYKFSLLYGENEGLKNDITQFITDTIKKKDNDIELTFFYENEVIDNEEIFYNSVYSGSLFSNKKIIVLKNSTDKILNQINDILEKLPENIFLIVLAWAVLIFIE